MDSVQRIPVAAPMLIASSGVQSAPSPTRSVALRVYRFELEK
jgi:hypothetical protein